MSNKKAFQSNANHPLSDSLSHSEQVDNVGGGGVVQWGPSRTRFNMPGQSPVQRTPSPCGQTDTTESINFAAQSLARRRETTHNL